MAQSVLDAFPAPTAVVQPSGVVVATNAAWVDADSAWCPAIGTSWPARLEALATEGVAPAGAAASAVRSVLDGTRHAHSLDHQQLRDGEVRWYALRISGLGPPTDGALVTLTDVTSRKRAEGALAYQALHDALTALPNRALFLDRLGLALARLGRRGTTVAVLFLDLDGFKAVNDGLGHQAGDQVIVAMAGRLRAVVRPGDTAARLGGDELTVLCEDIAGAGDAIRIAERVVAAIGAPLRIGEHEVALTTSLGIAVAGATSTTPEALLRDADAAMYRAKQAGPGRWALFDEGMRRAEHERSAVGEALRMAPERGEVEAHLQPLVGAVDGVVRRAEALARWRHPQRGLLPAAEWLDVAEETGAIVPIGRRVLEEACRWAAGGPASEPARQVSVNLSARQLGHRELVDEVAAVLQSCRLAAPRLWVEVTESDVRAEPAVAEAVLWALHDLGVRISLDGFGAGYMAPGHLRALPLDAVELHRSVVAEVDGESAERGLLRGLADLGHALGLEVVVEGVETDVQLRAAVECGADLVQGLYVGPPVAGDGPET